MSAFVISVAVTVVFVIPPSRAYATETHTFNAILSLTGGITTSSLDPVPDPGSLHPEEEGVGLGSFRAPRGIATDLYGDTYVSSLGSSGIDGRIDIFNPTGEFVLEIFDEHGPRQLAVDSAGNLYVSQASPRSVVRYPPLFDFRTGRPPATASWRSDYGEPVPIVSDSRIVGIGIDQSTDRLYVSLENWYDEYNSAANGSELLRAELGAGVIHNSEGLSVDASSGKVYVAGTDTAELRPSVVKVFDDAGNLVGVIDGKTCLEGGFKSGSGNISVAAEEATGHLFVGDLEGRRAVFEFDGTGGCVSTIEHSFIYVLPSEIAVDNSAGSPNQGALYVPSNPSGVGHIYAFLRKPPVGAPEVQGEAVSGLSETEALLEGEIKPNGDPTSYRFEYVDDSTFQRDISEYGPGHGFDHAETTIGGEELHSTGYQFIKVTSLLARLSPETGYHFRLVATNSVGTTVGPEHVFATYPSSAHGLPDGRAYELVTPPSTNGHAPTGSGYGVEIPDRFDTLLASPDGESVIFETTGGALPGLGGTGGLGGDAYEAIRGAAGWHTIGAGPSGAQAETPNVGGVSPDHGFSFWETGGNGGSLVIDGRNDHYLREPDGNYSLIGRGDLGQDSTAIGKRITSGAGHVIFTTCIPSGECTPVQLEANAPSTGTAAIYDRTVDGTTHVVSLLPDGATPTEDAYYLGSSENGEAVAFKLGAAPGGGLPDPRPIYLRVNNEATLAASRLPNGVFAGLSAQGNFLFYEAEGNIYRFDTQSGETDQLTESGDTKLVNISTDGSHVYFVSPSQLQIGKGIPGGMNLYVWAGESPRYIATLTAADIEGRNGIGGLGLWIAAISSEVVTQQGEGVDPSRTTPDGHILVFESHANLTGYDANDHAEVYRYNASSEELLCLSCNPTLQPAVSDAGLQALPTQGAPSPTGPLSGVGNVTEDGNRVFFQTADPLVANDVNGMQDVYEWEASGTGSCVAPSGCHYLISSGHSDAPSYLYGVGDSGRDVFFVTEDRLLHTDAESTASIYDARVNGGFPEEPGPSCEGEACRGAISQPPSLTLGGSALLHGSGNYPSCRRRHRCRKHRHHRGHHHRHSRRRSGSSRRTE